MTSLVTRARRLRHEQTSAEAVLWRLLRGRRFVGWKFRRQHPVGPFVVDFVCLAASLVVEVDGVTHDGVTERDRDSRRTAYLHACRFRLVRVSNQDVYDNLDGVAEMLRLELELPFR
ncbi:endonuclease domain-containing protein [Xanthobacter sp. VTT E-85241]|uniref:endonuclease domain-containing protein n=1 Tax=Roseixanthobacter finlandensis TaxID=3119922 RepID=UPI00372A1C7E